MNPHSTYFPYLDGWRGCAILLLLVGHFFPIPGINLGAAGVNLFFVLSGLLMARVLFVHEVPIPSFYQRRASRIFPAMFCFVLLTTTGYLAAGIPVSWTEFSAAVVFLINYFPGKPGDAVMPFGHIWSLCVEEHSYVMLSMIALAARARIVDAKFAIGALSLIFAASGVYYWLTYEGAHLAFDRWIHSEVSAFGIFASAFFMLAFEGTGMRRHSWALVPALTVIGLGLHWWSVPAPIQTVLGVGAFALAVNLLAGAGARLHSALSLAPLRRLGLWSFSIYLWQQPFYIAVHRNGLAPWAGLAMAIAAGVASFYLLENPARNYLNRKWAWRRTSAGLRPDSA